MGNAIRKSLCEIIWRIFLDRKFKCKLSFLRFAIVSINPALLYKYFLKLRITLETFIGKSKTGIYYDLLH